MYTDKRTVLYVASNLFISASADYGFRQIIYSSLLFGIV